MAIPFYLKLLCLKLSYFVFINTYLKNTFAAKPFTPIFAKISFVMKLTNRSIIFTLFLIVLAVATKLIFASQLVMGGFTPIFAIALFSGMIVKNKNAAFLLPLIALFVSDVVIEILFRTNNFAFKGFYKGQIFNYALLLGTALIGWALRGKNYASIALGAVAAPTFFFLVSNFTVWLASTITYSKDVSGLIACYVAGLPFYKNEIIATFFFLPVIMFAYNYIVLQKSKLVIA